MIDNILRWFFQLYPEKPKLSDDYQAETWRRLQESVIAIQTSTRISHCLEELYQAVENMCSYKMAPQLYDNLKGT